MSDTYRFRPAQTIDYPKVIEMWMAGISSDRVAIASVADTWWKRLLFKHVAGRRIFVQDMDTFVIETEQGLCGYVGLQKEEKTISVFDWGLALNWDGSAEEAFDVLMNGILDQAYAEEETDFLILGMEKGKGDVRFVVSQMDFHLLDYQCLQLVSDLPIQNPMDRGEMELSLSRQVGPSFNDSKAKWIEAEYPMAQEAEAVSTVHNAIPSRAQIFEIKESQEPVGFVQVSNHKEESRFIYALERVLWGSDFEKLLLTSFCSQLSKNAKKVRIRTFSRAHMNASRSTLETLGLVWEEAPWERWIHSLFEVNEDEEGLVNEEPASTESTNS